MAVHLGRPEGLLVAYRGTQGPEQVSQMVKKEEKENIKKINKTLCNDSIRN